MSVNHVLKTKYTLLLEFLLADCCNWSEGSTFVCWHTELLLIRNIFFFCKLRKIKLYWLKFYHPESYPAVLKSIIKTLNKVINTYGSTCELLTPRNPDWLLISTEMFCAFSGVVVSDGTSIFMEIMHSYFAQWQLTSQLKKQHWYPYFQSRIVFYFYYWAEVWTWKKPVPHAAGNITENLALLSQLFLSKFLKSQMHH